MTITKQQHRTVRAAVVALIALTVPLALTACSTSRDTPTDAEHAGVGAVWGACMRQAGVDVQDPSDEVLRSGATTIPDGVDQDRFAEASGQCSQEAGVEHADTAQKQQWEREYAQVAACIREEYPDFPEQEPGVIDVQDYPRGQDPDFQDRANACTRKYSPDTKGVPE